MLLRSFRCSASSHRSSAAAAAAATTIKNRPYSSVSSDEVSHFDRLASTWWDPAGSSRLLHLMNPARISYVRDRLDGLDLEHGQRLDHERDGPFWLRGRKVLDVGCGGGILSESLRRLGADVVGLDASGEGIHVARRHAREHGLLTLSASESSDGLGGGGSGSSSSDRPGSLTYEHATIEDHAKQHAGSYDLVFAMEILEHVNNPARFLQTCVSMLKPPPVPAQGASTGGGLLLLSTIEKTRFARFITITVAEQLLQLVPHGTHDSSKFIPRLALERWCREMSHGLGQPSPGVAATTASMTTLPAQQLTEAATATDTGRVGASLIDTRGCIFDPLAGKWRTMPAGAAWTQQCNYFATIERTA